MNFTPNIRKSAQSFGNVLQKAKEWFATIPKTEQQNLIDDLEHGAGHLTNIPQLKPISPNMAKFIRPNCSLLMNRSHLKFGTKMVSAS